MHLPRVVYRKGLTPNRAPVNPFRIWNFEESYLPRFVTANDTLGCKKLRPFFILAAPTALATCPQQQPEETAAANPAKLLYTAYR